MFPVSGITGDGIPALKQHLSAIAGEVRIEPAQVTFAWPSTDASRFQARGSSSRVLYSPAMQKSATE